MIEDKNNNWKWLIGWVFPLLATACFVFLSGVTWEHFYFPLKGSVVPRMQTEALMQGHFAISAHIQDIRFDTAWYGGSGVQQVWGLGMALWILPFELVARLLGYASCPDIIPLISLLFCLSLYTTHIARMLIQRGFGLPGTGLFSVMVLLCPALVNLLNGKKLVYEVTCLYAMIFALLLLLVVIRYLIGQRRFDFLLGCALAGFIALVRPTFGIYGMAAGILLSGTALLNWRKSGRTYKQLLFILSGSAVTLAGFLFLAWSNWVRFGAPFEFGHNLNFSAGSIVYLTRFGHPCGEASLWELGRELFCWVFIPWAIKAGQADIPRWRDIYQTTFDPTYLVILGLICWLLWKSGRSPKTENETTGWKRRLTWGLLFWFGLTFPVLCVFYLSFDTLSTRYILDMGPAFLALTLCPLFIPNLSPKLTGWIQKSLYAWCLLQIIWVAVLYPHLTRSSADEICFRWEKKPFFIPEKFLGKTSGKPQEPNTFNGSYTLEKHPVTSNIEVNGRGWDMADGEADYIVQLLVDKPQYLELLIGPEEADREAVYRAKINNIELPLEYVRPAPTGTNTLNGTNAAFLVRFSIPEPILRQDNDQLVSLCFTPSYHEKDLECTRTLYQVRWRDPEPVQ